MFNFQKFASSVAESKKSDKSAKLEKPEKKEIAVYALCRDGKVVGAPFFATEVSLYQYVDSMLDAMPFAFCVDAFCTSWKEKVGQIKKLAIFDPNTGSFENLADPLIVDWSCFDRWTFYSNVWCNLRKENLPDENRDEKTGKIKLPD